MSDSDEFEQNILKEQISSREKNNRSYFEVHQNYLLFRKYSQRLKIYKRSQKKWTWGIHLLLVTSIRNLVGKLWKWQFWFRHLLCTTFSMKTQKCQSATSYQNKQTRETWARVHVTAKTQRHNCNAIQIDFATQKQMMMLWKYEHHDPKYPSPGVH